MREALLVEWRGTCGFAEVEGRRYFIHARAFSVAERRVLHHGLRLKVGDITPDQPSPRIGRAVIEER